MHPTVLKHLLLLLMPSGELDLVVNGCGHCALKMPSIALGRLFHKFESLTFSYINNVGILTIFYFS